MGEIDTSTKDTNEINIIEDFVGKILIIDKYQTKNYFENYTR